MTFNFTGYGLGSRNKLQNRRTRRRENRAGGGRAARQWRTFGGIEELEKREMLSVSTFYNDSVDFDGGSNNDPILTTGIYNSLENGVDALQAELNGLEGSSALDVAIPGLLVRTPGLPAAPDFAPLLSNVVDDIGLAGILESQFDVALGTLTADSSRASALVSALQALDNTIVTGEDSLDYVLDVSGVTRQYTSLGGDQYELRINFTFTLTLHADETGRLYQFDPGRDMDQNGFTYNGADLESSLHRVELLPRLEADVTIGTIFTVEQGDFDDEADVAATPEDESTAANDTRITANNSGFFIDDTSLEARVFDDPAQADLQGFNLRIGLLGIRATSVDFDLNGRVTQTLVDPTPGDGRITLADLEPLPIIEPVANLDATTTTGGFIRVQMPIAVQGIDGVPTFATEVTNGLSPKITLGSLSTNPFHVTVNGLDPANDLDADVSNNDGRTNPPVTLTDFTELNNFTNLTAGGLLSLINDLSTFFNDLRNSPSPSGVPDPFAWFDTPIPFAVGVTLGDVLDLGTGMYERLVFDEANFDEFDATTWQLSDDDGNPRFLTFQQFVSALRLPAVLDVALVDVATEINPHYNAATNEVTFELNFETDFAYDASVDAPGVQNAPIDFEMDFNVDGLSDLGVLRLTSESEVGLTGNAVFNLSLGYRLTPLGDLFTLGSGTLLSALNGGQGVDLGTAGNDIRITLSDGTVHDVNISFDPLTLPNPTVGDVLALLGGLTGLDAVINTETDAIDVIDLTFTPMGGTFRIEQLNGSLAGLGLGLVRADQNFVGLSDNAVDVNGFNGTSVTFTPDGVVDEHDADSNQNGVIDPGDLNAVFDGPRDGRIQGLSLHGDSLAKHFFMEGSSIDSTVELEQVGTDGVESTLMRYGFVGLTSTGGTATVSADIDVDFPGTQTLARLRDGLIDDTSDGGDLTLDDIVNATVTGSGEVVLANVALEDASGITGLALGAAPEISVAFGDIANPTFTITPTDLGNVTDFTQVTFEHIRDAILAVKGFFADLATYTQFGEDLPIIGQSFSDLVGFVDDVQQVVDDFADNAFDTVQQLRERLIEALGLDAASASSVNVTAVPGSDAELVFSLFFDKNFTAALPIDVDLGIEGIANLGGSANMGVSGGATVELGIAIDLDDPTHPELIDDQTSIDLNFRTAGDNLNFTAAIGPFGLYIVGGNVVTDADGDVTTSDPLTLSLTIEENEIGDSNDNRHSLVGGANLADIAGDAVIEFVGDASASLPVFFPSSTSYLGNVDISIDGDLNDFFDDPSNLVISTPDFASLLSDFSLLDAIPLILDGLDQFLGGFQRFLDLSVFGNSFPLVGDGLSSANTFIQDFRDGLLADIRQNIEEAPQVAFGLITTALNDALAGIRTGAASLAGDQTDEAIWSVPLSRTISKTIPLGTGFGLPALGIELNGSVQVDLTFDFTLGFGVSIEDGFFITLNDPAGDPELDVHLDVTLPGFDAEGNLLFLTLEAEDNGSSFSGDFSVDLSDPSDGTNDDLTRLTFAELPTVEVDAALQAEAVIDLHLTAGFGSDTFPSIQTDFLLEWMFDGSDLAGNLPEVSFNDVTLDLGTFISDFLGGTLGRIYDDFIEPIQPVIDVLTDPIPVISDLAGEDISLLDIAGLFGFVDTGLLESIVDIIDFGALVSGLDGTTAELNFGDFSLADAGVDLRGLGSYDDIGDLNIPGIGSVNDLVNELVNQDGFIGDIASALTPLLGDGNPVAEALNDALPGAFGGTGDVGGFSFPFLEDPSQIIGLFLGKPAVLLGYDLAPLEFGFSYSQFFPIFGPLGASITGSIGATIDLAFGYDTFGVQRFAETGFRFPGLIFDGFFLSDNPSSVTGSTPLGTGPDTPEITITGSLIGAAELNIGIAKAGVGGGVEATITFDLNDPNLDGRVRGSEVLGNFFLGFPNPLSIFDVGFELDAILTWYLEFIFGPSFGGEIGRVNLLDVEVVFEKPPILGEVLGGELRLYSGPSAPDRLYRNVEDGDEQFTVTQTGAGAYSVSAFGHTQNFTGVSEIFADLGFGDDTISFVGVDVPVTVKGGFGNDSISFDADSVGPATVEGGSGNDTITGSAGADSIIGEKGRDSILGMDGDDSIAAGDDEDVVLGGLGNDSIEGDSGDDTLRGEEGDDSIYGYDGNDSVMGGADADSILGGAGNDSIAGGEDFDNGADGNDTILGESGNDVLAGDNALIGSITLYGGGGNDSISGGIGDDCVFGDTGNDTLVGDAGHDFMRGNEGTDSMLGSLGFDTMFGDADNDTILGQSDDDLIFGGAGSDTISGGTGNDIVFGDDGLVAYVEFMPGVNKTVGDGDPTLVSGSGFDTVAQTMDLIVTQINATDGDDSVDGGAGEDTVLGGAGDDEVYGDFAGNPSPTAAFAFTDVLIGDGGRVQLNERRLDLVASRPHANSGDDTITGNGGNDLVIGGGGSDRLYGRTATGGPIEDPATTDDDLIIGDDGQFDAVTVHFPGDPRPTTVFASISTDQTVAGGQDSLLGNDGHDTLFGGQDNDTVQGNDGDDVIVGDNGEVLFDSAGEVALLQTTDTSSATGGDDSLLGNVGDDIILGGNHNDSISGDTGGDILVGDNGLLDYDTGDADTSTLDLIQTTRFQQGDADSISGHAGSDTILGGDAGDTILGDNTLAGAPVVGPGADVVIGDQGELLFSGGIVTAIRTTDTAEADGGSDTVRGNEHGDTILGGTFGDSLRGNAAGDVVVGDEGELRYDLPEIVGGDGDLLTLDRVATTDFTLGGADTIFGNAASDTALGGSAGDLIFGDNDGGVDLAASADVLIGDQGFVLYRSASITRIETTDLVDADGGADTIEGNDHGDTILGGVAGDLLRGEASATSLQLTHGNDVILGDEGLLRYDVDTLDGGDGNPATLDLIATGNPTLGGDDTIHGNNGSDTALGGAADDLIYGDLYDGGPGNALTADNGPGADVLLGDGGHLTYSNTALTLIQSIDTALGGIDTVEGNEKNDTILGGAFGDLLFGEAADANLSLTTTAGGAGNDVVLGDNGELNYVLASDTLDGRPELGATVALDASPANLDRITTIAPNDGGNDTIKGNGGHDTVFAGTAFDLVYGDTSDAGAGTDGPDGRDLLFGDHAKIYPTIGGAQYVSNNFFAIDTQESHAGNDDTIFGNAADDTMLGQQGDDVMFGGLGNDDMIGGHNVVGGHDEMDDMDQALIDAILSGAVLANNNPIDINNVNDVMDGGGQQDMMAGDNAIMVRQATSASPRYRTLSSTQIYSIETVGLGGDPALFTADIDFDPNVTGAYQLRPEGGVGRTLILIDHTQAIAIDAAGQPDQPRVFGNDVMAGGGQDDELFGQLGDDVIQGDGKVEFQSPLTDDTYDPSPAADPTFTVRDDQTAPTYFTVLGQRLHFTIVEALTDGDDYIEGNGGNDRLYGNLGQDDLIGGSSELFGLNVATAAVFGLTGQNLRPDAADLIYGGAGDPTRLARNDYLGTNTVFTAAANDALIGINDRHARDADVIMGDNANVFKLVSLVGGVGPATQSLRFAYDQTSSVDTRTSFVQPRGVDLLDYSYSYSSPETASGLTFSGIGLGDLAYGESGDDTIMGMTGDDVVFGNSEDDDLYGQEGHDWVSGGTGTDGVLGDDGLIYTSRNVTTYDEPLYGINRFLSGTPGKFDNPADYLNGEITTPGDIQRAIVNIGDELKRTVNLIAFESGGNDILYGGLNNDWMHSGFGDDAVSGAEALPDYYNGGVPGFAAINNLLRLQQAAPTVPGPAAQQASAWFGIAPYNPGDILRYEGNNPGEQEFALYDEFNPRRKVMLDANGEAVETAAAAVYDFLLNFNELEGPLGFAYTGDASVMATDGDDRIFGDLGHDWVVGGSGRDHMYGGRGDDLVNLDDNHDSGASDPNGNPKTSTTDALDNTNSDEFQAYSDIVYGGSGRDVMILNTGADRAMDWVGEYNSFIVPFSPFGAFHISRNLQPFTPEYLYDLSQSDGADGTAPDGARYVTQKQADVRTDDPFLNPVRNGEPFGELGLVLQTDFDWQEQTGAPNDPQPGNFNGKREIMRRELFTDSGATALPFAVDQGSAKVTSGKYAVAPTAVGGEVVSLYHLDQIQPSYLEILVTMNIDKATAGYKANGYVIFDYQSPTDFKFAGIDTGLDKLRIGHRTADGWVVDAQTNLQMAEGKDYKVTVTLHGTVATVYVGSAAGPSFDFGNPLNDFGMIGLGTDGAKARFDDFQVQKLPPVWTFTFNDAFDGTSGSFTPAAGSWTPIGGRLIGSPSGSDRAIALRPLGVAATSRVELQTHVQTSGFGGLVFDYYGPEDFKFAALDAASGKVVIGHHTSRGWVIDASANVTVNAAGHTLTATLIGSSVSVLLDGRAVTGFVYNSLLNDGDLGLIARNGPASFDDFMVRGDDPAYQTVGTAITAESEGDRAAPASPSLTPERLAPILRAAAAYWADRGFAFNAGDVQLTVADLPGVELGSLSGNTITLDTNAAGNGWFVDRTPRNHREFRATSEDGTLLATRRSPAQDRIDLLTVVTHELGHFLGIAHEADTGNVMSETLGTGQRKTESAASQTAAASVSNEYVADLFDGGTQDGRASKRRGPGPTPQRIIDLLGG